MDGDLLGPIAGWVVGFLDRDARGVAQRSIGAMLINPSHTGAGATNFGFNLVTKPGTNPYPNQVFAPPAP